MAPLRICSFNVENLFTRPKILSLKDNDRISVLLAKLARFKELFDKPSYAGFEQEILELYRELNDYIEINVKARKDGVPRDIITEDKLNAKGSGDFVGFVELRKANFNEEQIFNTARVIKAVKADIQAFVEIEGRAALQRFDTDVLKNFFDDVVVVDGNDPRGIDVGLAARKAQRIQGIRTNVLARDDKPGYVFSRDCLEASFDFRGKQLHLLINHFKAKDRTPRTSDAKRKRQASKVSEILTKRYDLKKDFVVVVGDFNDEPDSAPLAPLVATPGLHDAFDVVNRPPFDRWTYYYASKKVFNRIDQIYVSAALKPFVAAAGIERRGIADLEKLSKGKEKSFPEVTSWSTAASDHAAVWVDLAT